MCVFSVFDLRILTHGPMDPWTSGELFSELGFWDEGSLGSLVVPILHLSSENKNSLRLFNVRVFFCVWDDKQKKHLENMTLL